MCCIKCAIFLNKQQIKKKMYYLFQITKNRDPFTLGCGDLFSDLKGSLKRLRNTAQEFGQAVRNVLSLN